MTPIHLAGEMAVWSEDKWAAFEGELQSQLRAERRRLDRLRAKRQSPQSAWLRATVWGFFSAAILLVLFY